MEKKYTSTRSKGIQAHPKDAIIKGLAADGGLFVFDDIDKIKLPLKDMMKMNYKQMAEIVLAQLLFDFSEQEVKQCVEQAYEGQFDNEEITPLVFHEDDIICELFHGPTSAFKDVGLRMLPQLMSVALKKKKNDKVMILTATSGDTGKAALVGFQDVDNIGITVFYPDNGVSEIQRLQMVTQQGNNTNVVAIKGNFDDAQSGVKRIFHDASFQKAFKQNGIIFSSANSINIGRLIPQIVYYIYSYKRLVDEGRIAFGDPIDFCVPTGNFGNVLAGYYAKMMGLPVHRFIVAANANHVLYDFLTTGIYNRNRPFHKTISPSMDILISSNLERLLYYASDKDAQYVASVMDELNSYGKYQVKTSVLTNIQSLFSVGYASDEECVAAIQSKYRQDGYVLDPHSACGYAVMKKVQDKKYPCVLMATASPYKFCTAVYEALFDQADKNEFHVMEQLEQKTGTIAPSNLKGLKDMEVRHTDVIEVNEMKSCVEMKTKGLFE